MKCKLPSPLSDGRGQKAQGHSEHFEEINVNSIHTLYQSSRQLVGQYLITGNDRFLPYPTLSTLLIPADQAEKPMNQRKKTKKLKMKMIVF
jgi:hypothetical protein